MANTRVFEIRVSGSSPDPATSKRHWVPVVGSPAVYRVEASSILVSGAKKKHSEFCVDDLLKFEFVMFIAGKPRWLASLPSLRRDFEYLYPLQWYLDANGEQAACEAADNDFEYRQIPQTCGDVAQRQSIPPIRERWDFETLRHYQNGTVAQLAEHQPHKLEDVGSYPTGSTNNGA